MAEGEQADLGALPALKQHGGDVGHYITAGHVVTADPDTGYRQHGDPALLGARKRG